MLIKRTANAGVLLHMDGKSILLDGVCNEVAPYIATPQTLREQLLEVPPDAVAYTHIHPDHYDGLFVSQYLQKTAGPVLGPAEIPCSITGDMELGTIRIQPVKSHHMGNVQRISHRSYVLQGSRCVWFMGDASPAGWQSRSDLPKPDVLIAPYGFAIGHGWKVTKALAPAVVVLVHLPEPDCDTCGLWNSVRQTVENDRLPQVIVPAIGEQFVLK